MDVKLKEGRAECIDAWLLTIPPVGRADLKSEVVRLVPEGSSVPALGRDCATLWVAVFNPDPKAEKKYELSLRSEEHTSELQSLAYLVCRLLLEKKKTKN